MARCFDTVNQHHPFGQFMYVWMNMPANIDPLTLWEPLSRSRRILVLGSSGSGKTTLTRKLADAMNLAPIHLDAQFWHPGWIHTPQEKWRQVVHSLVERPSFIMDGTYESTLDIRIPRSDFLILVNESRYRCLWRIVKRKLTIDDANRPDAPPGQPIDRAFLRYVWNYPKVTAPFVWAQIERYGAGTPVMVLHGSGDVRRLIARFNAR